MNVCEERCSSSYSGDKQWRCTQTHLKFGLKSNWMFLQTTSFILISQTHLNQSQYPTMSNPLNLHTRRIWAPPDQQNRVLHQSESFWPESKQSDKCSPSRNLCLHTKWPPVEFWPQYGTSSSRQLAVDRGVSERVSYHLKTEHESGSASLTQKVTTAANELLSAL